MKRERRAGSVYRRTFGNASSRSHRPHRETVGRRISEAEVEPGWRESLEKRGDYRGKSADRFYRRSSDISSDSPEGRNPSGKGVKHLHRGKSEASLCNSTGHAGQLAGSGSPVPRLSGVKIERGTTPGTAPWHRCLPDVRVYDKLMVFRGSTFFVAGLTRKFKSPTVL